MRFRVGLLLCLILAFVGSSCRKALEPTTDNNQAPETWITAAPQDSITTRSPVGVPIPPTLTRVPVRFHLYWAGSDQDGAVSGYYWAVVETTATSSDGGGLPQLPGPKASDYHFTTNTDSTFVFRASEDVSEREHAFYVYSVDNKGKADATPARFVFRAYDRFPPVPIIVSAVAVGTVYDLLPGGGVSPRIATYTINDSFDIERPFPRDTVPSSSVLTFTWRGEPTAPNTHVLGYRYKLDEPAFNVVDSSVHSAVYNTGVGGDVIAPGTKRFTLRAVGESGWRGQVTRYFQMNFAPDSWFAGPSLNVGTEGWSTYTDGQGKRYWYKDVTWTSFSGVPGTLLGSDSVNVLPSSRPARKTFFEVYKDRLWAHEEGDTVHLNSWVILPAGGFDPDSPYRAKVGVDPNRPDGIVTRASGPNGSPIGFRSLVFTSKLDGNTVRPTETAPFPVFDLASVYHSPHISAYSSLPYSGTAYGYVVAEDGDGTVDRRIMRLASRPDSIVYWADVLHLPAAEAIRSKVMMFHVNHAPFLKTTDNAFAPKVPTAAHPLPFTVTRTSNFNILADDLDPIDYSKPVFRIGGPQDATPPVLVRTIDIIGKNAAGNDTTFNVATNQENANFTGVSIPSYIVPGTIYVRIKLADNRPTDTEHGARFLRAVDRFGVTQNYFEYPVTLLGPGPEDAATEAVQQTQRPGSPTAAGRRQ